MTVFATTLVAILDPVTGQHVGVCRGPRPDGGCSAPSRDGVGCAEHLLLAELAGDRRRIRLFVPADLERCPLAPPPRIPLHERRDPELRARRDAVAHWFGLHPASLAALDELTLTRMLGRISSGSGRPPVGMFGVPAQAHPWAG